MIQNESETTENTFPKKKVESIVKKTISSFCRKQDAEYCYEESEQWVNDITETLMKKLTGIPSYKFISSCLIMQNNGSGFHIASSALLDYSDGFYTYKFGKFMFADSVEGKNLMCVINVYGFSI